MADYGPSYTTKDLIANIQRRCLVPESQLTFLPADFCALASDTLQEEVFPLIMSTREEMFVDFVDVPAPSNNMIPMPVQTVSSKVRSICYLYQNNPQVLVNLPRIDLDTVAGVGCANFNTTTGFYLQGNNIVLYPIGTLPSGTVIRIFFYRRALVLIDSTLYAQITNINTMTNVLTLSLNPFSWTTSTQLNSVSTVSPFPTTNYLMNITQISSPTITVDNITGLSVGDYICEVGYSAIPQIPIECQGYLAQLTAAKCLEALGDTAGTEAAMKKANSLKESLLILLSDRVDGSVKRVVNPNGGLRLASSLGYRRNGTGGGFW